MGYTHYWSIKRPITALEMAMLADDVNHIVIASEIPVAYEYDEPGTPPQLDAEGIHLNGIDDDGHETFSITGDATSFDFCKTASKPYDVIVTASLLALKDRLGDAVRLNSDGEPVDWVAGHVLAERALARRIERVHLEGGE